MPMTLVLFVWTIVLGPLLLRWRARSREAATPRPRTGPIPAYLSLGLGIAGILYIVTSTLVCTHGGLGGPYWPMGGLRTDPPDSVRVIDADGENMTVLATTRWAGEGPGWSPDGRYIAFTAGPLHVVEADRAQRAGGRPISVAAWGGLSPTWSPDGRQVAFDGDKGLCIGDISSRDLRVVAEEGDEPIGDPQWCPTAPKIAMLRYGGGHVAQIASVDADGSGEARLTNRRSRETVAGESGCGDLAWSPDGRRIAFVRPADQTSAQVFVINADGTGEMKLGEGLTWCDSPCWSPDGQQLVFATGSSKRLCIINADGTDCRMLPGVGDEAESPFHHAWDPAWSPDGERIAFVWGRYHAIQLYVADEDGANARCLTPGSGRASDPAWSPDGTRIVYNYEASELPWQIMSMVVMGLIGPLTVLLGAHARYHGASARGAAIAGLLLGAVPALLLVVAGVMEALYAVGMVLWGMSGGF